MTFNSQENFKKRMTAIASALQKTFNTAPALTETADGHLTLNFSSPSQANQFCRDYYTQTNGGKPLGKFKVEQQGQQVIIKNAHMKNFLNEINYQGPKYLEEWSIPEQITILELVRAHNGLMNYNFNAPPQRKINGVTYEYPVTLKFADAEQAKAFANKIGVNDNKLLLLENDTICISAKLPYDALKQGLTTTKDQQHTSSYDILTKLQPNNPQPKIEPKPANLNTNILVSPIKTFTYDYEGKGPRASLAQHFNNQLKEVFDVTDNNKINIEWNKDSLVIDFGKVGKKTMEEIQNYYSNTNPGLPIKFEGSQMKITGEAAINKFLNSDHYAGPKPNFGEKGPRASLADHLLQGLQNKYELGPKKININWSEKGLVIEMLGLSKDEMQALKSLSKDLHLENSVEIEGNKIKVKSENVSDFLNKINYKGPTPKVEKIEHQEHNAPQPVSQAPHLKM